MFFVLKSMERIEINKILSMNRFYSAKKLFWECKNIRS